MRRSDSKMQIYYGSVTSEGECVVKMEDSVSDDIECHPVECLEKE